MDKTGWRAELTRAKNDIPKPLFANAVIQIAVELRRSAYTVEAEAKRREASARSRAEHNAILYQDRNSGAQS